MPCWFQPSATSHLELRPCSHRAGHPRSPLSGFPTLGELKRRRQQSWIQQGIEQIQPRSQPGTASFSSRGVQSCVRTASTPYSGNTLGDSGSKSKVKRKQWSQWSEVKRRQQRQWGQLHLLPVSRDERFP